MSERKERTVDTLRTTHAFIQTVLASHALVLCASFKKEKSLYVLLVFTIIIQKGHSEKLKNISMLFSILTNFELESH